MCYVRSSQSSVILNEMTLYNNRNICTLRKLDLYAIKTTVCGCYTESCMRPRSWSYTSFICDNVTLRGVALDVPIIEALTISCVDPYHVGTDFRA